MLSVVVFTFWPEEENYIQYCLESVKFAGEVIVIDNGATSKTLEIAKKYTSKIYHHPSKDFAERHNFAMEKTRGDWILFIDADERISRSLQKEIDGILENSKADAFELRRVNYFLGKEVRFGDRYPDYVTRLFKKDKLKSWSGAIHESSHVDGTVGRLGSPFFHLTHRSIRTMLEKSLVFCEPEAQLRLAANHPPVVWWRLPRVVITEAWTRIIVYQGFRQGVEGWIDGLFQALSMFIVYARLWELQRRPSLEKAYEEIDRKIAEGEI